VAVCGARPAHAKRRLRARAAALLRPAGNLRSADVTRGGFGHGSAHPVPPEAPGTPVVKDPRPTGSAGLAPARLRTALARLHTVENAAPMLSPGTARTAPGAARILLAAPCAVVCLSLLVGPWPGLARTSRPGAARPCLRMPCMPSATTISAGSSPRRCGARPARAGRVARLHGLARPPGGGRPAGGPGVLPRPREAVGRGAVAGGRCGQGQDRARPVPFVGPGRGAQALRGRGGHARHGPGRAAVLRHLPARLRPLRPRLLPRHRRPARVPL